MPLQRLAIGLCPWWWIGGSDSLPPVHLWTAACDITTTASISTFVYNPLIAVTTTESSAQRSIRWECYLLLLDFSNWSSKLHSYTETNVSCVCNLQSMYSSNAWATEQYSVSYVSMLKFTYGKFASTIDSVESLTASTVTKSWIWLVSSSHWFGLIMQIMKWRKYSLVERAHIRRVDK